MDGRPGTPEAIAPRRRGGGWARRLAAAFAAALVLQTAGARAQERYPSRPIKILVGYGPGGIADISTRIVAEKLSAILGQPVVVENQPTAGGITAARAALAGRPDGHTLALLTNGTAVSVSLIKNIGFDPVKDFAPVSSVAFFDFVLFTRADGPYRSIADLLAAGRSTPGGLNVGTVSVGSTQNLAAELLKSTAGLAATVIPYRQTPDLLLSLLRGDVDLMIDIYAGAKSAAHAGRVRAVATSGAKRSPLLPDVPTLQEAGITGYEVTSWNGLFAPARTPAAAVETLNRSVHEALADPNVRRRFLELGVEARGSTPEEIGARLKADVEKWADVIRKTGLAAQ